MDDYERILLVKPDVNVYRIPPRTTNRAYRASDWNLEAPDWICRLRLVAKGNVCYIKLDEKSTGQFFGQCPIDKYPGPAIESVSDSSRYFVLKLVNEQTNRTAFVGIGFTDRSESFDMNVTLQDHFKMVHMEENSSKEDDQGPKLDLGFKEGQTIKVNLNLGKKASADKSKSRPKASGGVGFLLPPPPGSAKTGSSSNTSKGTDDSFAQHSSFHQQLLTGLESLSVSDESGEKASKSTLPILTPANSFISDEFGSASPGRSPARQDKDAINFDVFAENKSSASTDTKKEQDLWSAFEAAPSSNQTKDNVSSVGAATSSTFEDWATF